ncbi:MAG TPA: BMP family ABC transporter substrate-binding protein [Lachnospiraceae bacterium]|nr:BMP family ABC transporter substrate-binding protein [Lachnospiraceae bacterium]
MNEEYTKAKRLGEKAYKKAVVSGRYPYLPALEEFFPKTSRGEITAGIMEIPLAQVTGTKTRGRQEAFADNFMPLLDSNTEFATKWTAIFNAQQEEGIRDPVKAYEYMWKFYILEGNKRVSVLKYINAAEVMADVIRILPDKNDEKDVRIYYEFDRFFRACGIYDIIFTEEGYYQKLADILGADLDSRWDEEMIIELKTGYYVFSKVYSSKAGQYNTSVSDAFLIYITVFGFNELAADRPEEIKKKIEKLHNEFLTVSGEKSIAFVEKPYAAEDAYQSLSVLMRPKLYTRKKPFKAAFIYDGEPSQSRWIYGHELGRNQLSEYYQGIVETSAFSGRESEESFENAVREAAEDHADLIVTTSPTQMDMALRAAVAYPRIKFINCSINLSYNTVRTYYGKMHEAKFLMGVLAASVAKGHRIGYVSDYPIYGAAARINAFAIGAAMVDPDISVYLTWTSLENGSWREFMEEKGIRTISGPDLINPAQASRDYGLYQIEDDQTVKNLAMPVWDWGKYYELIVRNIMNGGWDRETNSIKNQALNYWWGMSSGVIDVITSANLCYNTYKMLDIYKKAIVTEIIHPFDGELHSQNGLVKAADAPPLTNEEIVSMDWLNDNVKGGFPALSELTEAGKRSVKYSGIPSLYT